MVKLSTFYVPGAKRTIMNKTGIVPALKKLTSYKQIFAHFDKFFLENQSCN